MSERQKKRFSVVFHAADYGTLENLAHRLSKTKAEVLRDALALEQWYQEARADGGKLLIEQSDGRIMEVVSR